MSGWAVSHLGPNRRRFSKWAETRLFSHVGSVWKTQFHRPVEGLAISSESKTRVLHVVHHQLTISSRISYQVAILDKMASSQNVELEAAKFLHKLIQESRDEPAKLATKLYVILQHMKSSGKEHSMPYQTSQSKAINPRHRLVVESPFLSDHISDRRAFIAFDHNILDFGAKGGPTS
ncbi:Chromatin structure-remodeling complex protein SYD, partial [Cucurbita argyrosperma subsp. argyrosperma]